jgi:hypothetical protein
MHSNKQRSNTLDIKDSRDIGLYFSTYSLSPFLKTGTTLASFHSRGTTPVRSDLLNRSHSDGAITDAFSVSRRAGIPSGPCALSLSRVLKTAAT